MGKSAVLGVVTMVVSFSVYEGSIDCYNNDNLNREGILGKNVTFRCRTSWTCEDLLWDLRLDDRTVHTLSEEQVLVDRSTSYLSIFGIGFHQDGIYRCWCYLGDTAAQICSITLTTVCQATVRLNGRMIFYNSSSHDSSFVDVTVGETITITCSEGATLERGCAIDLLSASDELNTYSFEVLPEHNSCHVECLYRRRDGDSCTVGFTFNVARLEPTQTLTSFFRTSKEPSQSSVNGSALTSSRTNFVPVSTAVVRESANKSKFTIIPVDRFIFETAFTTMTVQQTKEHNANTSKSGSFPLIVPVLIVIIVVLSLAILSLGCFFIFHSRRNSASLSKKNVISASSSNENDINIGQTYENAAVCSEGYEMVKTNSIQPGVSCSKEFYDEVNCLSNSYSMKTDASIVTTEPRLQAGITPTVPLPMESAVKDTDDSYIELPDVDTGPPKEDSTKFPSLDNGYEIPRDQVNQGIQQVYAKSLVSITNDTDDFQVQNEYDSYEYMHTADDCYEIPQNMAKQRNQ